MEWDIDFITEQEFTEHVKNTIKAYGTSLQPFNLKKLNNNILDPVKMIFDKNVYQESWDQLIKNEIFRQRDKSNNNSIGYFHQRIFQYFKYCHVPDNGTEGGWDVIFNKESGILLPEGDTVHKIYVEMKNKHNTMNSASSGKTYIKMQDQLLQDDDCACFLVEAIATRHQNIKWTTSVNSQKVSHKRIRRVSIDEFYSIVTGEHDAFFKICKVLPTVIEKVVSESAEIAIPEDSAYQEIKELAETINAPSKEASMFLAIYLLGFNTYNGFNDII